MRVSEPVLDWLDEIAAAEGLSREEAIEYLVSSYWRLEEIVDLIEAGAPGGDTEVVDGPAADRSEWPDLDGLHDRFDTLIDELGEREERTDERVQLLNTLVELGDRLERLEEDLADGPPAESASAGESSDQLTALEARLDELEASVTAVEDRIDEVGAAAVTDETLAAVTEQTRSFQDSISRQHDSLRARVHTEFDHIRTILERLLDTTATNEARTERLFDEYEATYRAHLAQRERLEAIVRTANRRGVREAACEQCGATVDLGMLQSPVCPSCERGFTEIETSTGLLGLFPSHVLLVATDDGADRQSVGR